MTRVAIVMPTFAQGDHIADALDSLQAQRFASFIVHVVVDGPPDQGTRAAAAHYSGWPFFWHYLEENVGTAGALNHGFAACDAACEYYTWVSSDNVMAPNWLEVLVARLDATPGAGMAYSSYVREHGTIEGGFWAPQGASVYRTPPRPLIEQEDCHIGPAFLYRAEHHHEHRGAISHDLDHWLRMEEKCEFLWVDEPLCTYRVHGERVTITRRDTYDAPRWIDEAKRRRGA